jgi:hypothetical protein
MPHDYDCHGPNGCVVTGEKVVGDPGPRWTVEQWAAYYASMKTQQMKPQNGWTLPVTLLKSDNTSLPCPIKGVLVCFEQGVNLCISQAVFHCQHTDGSLGAPVVVNRPKFTYGSIEP